VLAAIAHVPGAGQALGEPTFHAHDCEIRPMDGRHDGLPGATVYKNAVAHGLGGGTANKPVLIGESAIGGNGGAKILG